MDSVLYYREGGMGLSKTLDCGCGCGGLKKSDRVKFKYAFYSAILFLLISSPEAYRLTTRHIGSWISSGGVPTPGGLVFHSFVFLIIVFTLMKIRT
jgi:hypothetical protein